MNKALLNLLLEFRTGDIDWILGYNEALRLILDALEKGIKSNDLKETIKLYTKIAPSTPRP